MAARSSVGSRATATSALHAEAAVDRPSASDTRHPRVRRSLERRERITCALEALLLASRPSTELHLQPAGVLESSPPVTVRDLDAALDVGAPTRVVPPGCVAVVAQGFQPALDPIELRLRALQLVAEAIRLDAIER